MLYEIVKTAVSRDKSVCYYVFRQNISIEGKSADTYGVSAADNSHCVCLCDILTDMDETLTLMKNIADNSVSVDGLREYVMNYMS